MISTEQGVYLQFFDEGEGADRELPPLGPFELLIVRHNRIIGDREAVEHDMLGAGSVERWLEAELELRRALGDEPGGVRRAYMRIRAPRGDIIVRFYDYAGDEAPKVPELGPFYSMVVGKREVRADDKLIAIRSTEMSPWTLTDAGRPGIAGINKADFSVFSLSARDPRAVPQSSAPQPVAPAPQAGQHDPSPLVSAPSRETAPAPAPMSAGLTPAAENGGPPGEFVERRKVQREIYVARPLPQQSEAQLTPADVNLILRVDKLKQQELAQQLMVERLRREQNVDPEASLRSDAIASLPMRFQPPVKERERAVAEAEEDEEEYEELSFTERLLGFLWAARIFLVTGLIILALVAAYGYLRAPGSVAAGPRPLAHVAMSERVQTSDWSYFVLSVERLQRIGSVPPRAGGYLVVHIAITRKTSDGVPPDPSQFVLVDSTGGQILPFAKDSDMYSGTGYQWAARYQMGTGIQNQLIFDVNPGSQGLRLLIKPANTDVRLPDP
jgi:hypothetical protein